MLQYQSVTEHPLTLGEAPHEENMDNSPSTQLCSLNSAGLEFRDLDSTDIWEGHDLERFHELQDLTSVHPPPNPHMHTIYLRLRTFLEKGL